MGTRFLSSAAHGFAVRATATSGIVALSSLAAGLPNVLEAQTPEASDALRDRVEAYQTVWNTHDATAVAAFFTGDADMIIAVDNGVAFSRREESDRGTRWRRLAVKRLPRKTVERLRAVTREELDRRLSVVAQFSLVGDQLVPVTPTGPIEASEGMRRRGDVVQLGLTDYEIGQVWGRIQNVLDEVDDGKIVLF